jgi:hypothetical protein
MVSYIGGSYLYSSVGFSHTIDSISIFIIAFTILYFVLCDKSMFGSKDITDEAIEEVLDMRRESLKESLLEKDHPATVPFRYIMARGYEFIV